MNEWPSEWPVSGGLEATNVPITEKSTCVPFVKGANQQMEKSKKKKNKQNEGRGERERERERENLSIVCSGSTGLLLVFTMGTLDINDT